MREVVQTENLGTEGSEKRSGKRKMTLWWEGQRRQSCTTEMQEINEKMGTKTFEH